MRLKTGYLVVFKSLEEFKNENSDFTIWPEMKEFMGRTHQIKKIDPFNNHYFRTGNGWLWCEDVIKKIIRPEDLPVEYRKVIVNRLLEVEHGN